jgi:rsbT antagonist protein RsbS
MTISSVQRIPLQVVRGCVVASIQIDLDPEVLRQLRNDLLECVQRSSANGVILDVSGVDILDLDDYHKLRSTMKMAEVMGARSILSGLKPGVVSALIDLGADPEGVNAVLNLDDAFQLLEGNQEKSARAAEILTDEHESNDDGQKSKSDSGQG